MDYTGGMFELALPLRTPLSHPTFLPTTRAEMDALGWDTLDILLITGDAYVDHPSFGVPLLGRWLMEHGYRVGIVAQPRWNETLPQHGGDPAEARGAHELDAGIADISRMGRPRLFAGVSAGALDSMLAHYTAFRRKRHDDAYTPGGKAGARPNRAVIVYANLVRRAFPGLPLVAGGIEASLRRVSHYDFWSDSLRRSLLFDARLDLLLFGMGERALLKVAQRLDAVAELVGDLSLLTTSESGRKTDTDAEKGSALWPDLWSDIPGTARIVRGDEMRTLTGANIGTTPDGRPDRSFSPRAEAQRLVWLPSHEDMIREPRQHLEGALLLERETHQMRRMLAQSHGTGTAGEGVVLVMPPAAPLTEAELDRLYALPFSRRPHPAYREPIPAVEMIATSITTHRGCGGGCSFCSLALHQGRRIASRSRASILEEAARIAAMPRGSSISDVGGPSANMWGATCVLDADKCRRESCMFPSICKGFRADQSDCVELLREVRSTPGVKHVRVASGVRFDLALKDTAALEAYTGEFTGGQLKIAPEHCVPDVLDLMRKPGMKPFEAFLDAFRRYSEAHGKEQYVIPYLISAFPGCTTAHMRQLADWLSARNWSPRQVQCFIPTPGTVATAMYYAQCSPDGASLYVARSDADRRKQHDILLGMEGREPQGRAPRGNDRFRAGAEHRPTTRTGAEHRPETRTGQRRDAVPGRGRRA